MENKIREVKERADIIEVARYLKINLNRANKCICPFHKEKTPSCSFSQSKQIFKCFGCGASGDSITLVAKLLNVNNYEAAKQINDIFRLGVDFGTKASRYEIAKYEQKIKAKDEFDKWENQTFQLLCNYLHSLNEEEYMQEGNITEYFIDEVFINGSFEDKLWFWKNNKGYVEKIKRKLQGRRLKSE